MASERWRPQMMSPTHTWCKQGYLDERFSVWRARASLLDLKFSCAHLPPLGVSRCWMTDTKEAWLAHYFTNIPLMIVLVLSGSVMLCVIYREIRTRAEWSKNRVAFLSIWGLSCLFGTTWGLALLDFGPLSDFVLFVSCILNSFQGEFSLFHFKYRVSFITFQVKFMKLWRLWWLWLDHH